MRLRNNQIIVCLVLVAYGVPAYAYLDPGTGSILIQGVIASIAAAGMVLKLYWHRLIDFLGLGKNKDQAPVSSDTDSDEQK